VTPRNMFWRLVWVFGLGAATLGAPAVPASLPGQAAADEVSVAGYQAFLRDWLYTRTGHNRGPAGAQHDLARDNIVALFQSYGLSTQLEAFTYNSGTWYNVVATQTGTAYPSRVYIIGAHYDSVNNPGADDNASGVAAVLEAARILSQYPSDATIKYIAFDREEAGLIGSSRYVSAHPGEDIRGMLSLDMVAYDPGTNHALIYGRTASNPIKTALAAALAEYSTLSVTVGGDVPQSDHAPFEAAGYQACLLIEGEVWNNPYYHTLQDCYDTAGYLNFAYAAEMTRTVVGWLVDAAGVQVPVNSVAFSYPAGRPEFAFPSGTTAVRVDVSGVGVESPAPGTGLLHYRVGPSWTTAPMESLSATSYRARLPGATCGTTVAYYFTVQGLSGTTYADPPGAPAAVFTATAAYGRVPVFQTNLDTNPGWAVEGQWAWGTPTGGGGEHGYPDPTGGYTGSKVYGYNLAGDYPNNLPERHLTSAALDCTGRSGTRLTFWRWLGVESPTYDHAYVRVSRNGTAWTTVWQNTVEITDAAWQYMDLDIAAVADNQPTVYLRWTMGATDGGWKYCGWNIDDIAVTALDCTPPLTAGDTNCDGVVDFDDIDPFILALAGEAAYHAVFPGCEYASADCNTDGAVNFDDIDPFVALLGG